MLQKRFLKELGAVHILYNTKMVFWTTFPPYLAMYNISVTP